MIASRQPSYIAALSEFELFRYQKYSKVFIALFKKDKMSAADYIQSLNLNDHELRCVRYYNNVALGRKIYEDG